MSHTDYSNIKVVAFDADDTLWVNETYFREAEDEVCKLLSEYETENKVRQELFRYEIKNLGIYGYGVKGFSLSMIECALEISNQQLSSSVIQKILAIGKDMLSRPVDILDGVVKTLEHCEKKYRLLVVTKGDLLDQERKLRDSGLTEFFHHVEIMSEKAESNYQSLLDHLSIKPEEFLMVGNSLKSDVLPPIGIGAKAIHVPYHTTWAHEQVKQSDPSTYRTVSKIEELKSLI